MPRHPSVPGNLTGWIRLGVISTDTATFAIVGAELAGILDDEWSSRYIDEDGNPLPDTEVAQSSEPLEFEEIPLTEHDTAVLFTTHCDGEYLVEGRFGEMYGDGHMSLTEIRIRLWGCECACHHPGQDNTCDGSCHDQDPE